MKLFVDTSGWVGLFMAKDRYHLTAAAAFKSLQTQPVELFTSDFVLDETLTFLRRHDTHANAVRFGNWVHSTDAVTLLYVDESIWFSAWEMFQAYVDKEWAFTDCTSFVLMQNHNNWQAFSFDHHFTQAGFQLWPG